MFSPIYAVLVALFFLIFILMFTIRDITINYFDLWLVLITAAILCFNYTLYTIIFNYAQKKLILEYLKDNKHKDLYECFSNILYYAFIHVYLFNYFFYFTFPSIFVYMTFVMLYLYYNYGLNLTESFIVLLKTFYFCRLVYLYPKIFLLVFVVILGIATLVLCITTTLLFVLLV